MVAPVPEIILRINALEDAHNARVDDLALRVPRCRMNGHYLTQRHIHQVGAHPLHHHLQGLIGVCRISGGPSSLQQSAAVWVEQPSHELDAAPGPGVLVPVEAGIARVEEGGSLQEPGVVGQVGLEISGHPVIHQLRTGLVDGSPPGGNGRLFQVHEDTNPEVDVPGIGLPQGSAQGRLGQQVGEDYAAGQQGHRQENAQEEHQFQPPGGGDSPSRHGIGQLQKGHASSMGPVWDRNRTRTGPEWNRKRNWAGERESPFPSCAAPAGRPRQSFGPTGCRRKAGRCYSLLRSISEGRSRPTTIAATTMASTVAIARFTTTRPINQVWTVSVMGGTMDRPPGVRPM